MNFTSMDPPWHFHVFMHMCINDSLYFLNLRNSFVRSAYKKFEIEITKLEDVSDKLKRLSKNKKPELVSVATEASSILEKLRGDAGVKERYLDFEEEVLAFVSRNQRFHKQAEVATCTRQPQM